MARQVAAGCSARPGVGKAFLWGDVDLEGDLEAAIESRDVESLREHYALTLRLPARRVVTPSLTSLQTWRMRSLKERP